MDHHPQRGPAGAAVGLRSVSRVYGRLAAIWALDLDIAAGEFVTLLGPSGSGKSTTLAMIAGFDRPTSGAILVGGEAMQDVPPHRRNIGMVFQNYALFPHLTVAENIAFSLKQRRVARGEIARRVEAMLALVQLPGLGGRYPQQLSGGQQQRVAIARAVVFAPSVLLMDEPLSALDKQLRESLLLEIRRLHAELGITFIYVTHDQKEALVMSDRVAVMNHGRIEQIAPPRTLYDAPATRFVASFVGEANFIEGGVAERVAGGCAYRIGETVLRASGEPGGTACMVRPEKIVLRAVPSGQHGMNALAATVTEVVFMGETTRYALRADGGAAITAKQPHRSEIEVFAPGQSVVMEWAVADTRLV